MHSPEKLGVDPQLRVHSDVKSTKIYTPIHVEWACVRHAEVKVG